MPPNSDSDAGVFQFEDPTPTATPACPSHGAMSDGGCVGYGSLRIGGGLGAAEQQGPDLRIGGGLVAAEQQGPDLCAGLPYQLQQLALEERETRDADIRSHYGSCDGRSYGSSRYYAGTSSGGSSQTGYAGYQSEESQTFDTESYGVPAWVHTDSASTAGGGSSGGEQRREDGAHASHYTSSGGSNPDEAALRESHLRRREMGQIYLYRINFRGFLRGLINISDTPLNNGMKFLL